MRLECRPLLQLLSRCLQPGRGRRRCGGGGRYDAGPTVGTLFLWRILQVFGRPPFGHDPPFENPVGRRRRHEAMSSGYFGSGLTVAAKMSHSTLVAVRTIMRVPPKTMNSMRATRWLRRRKERSVLYGQIGEITRDRTQSLLLCGRCEEDSTRWRMTKLHCWRHANCCGPVGGGTLVARVEAFPSLPLFPGHQPAVTCVRYRTVLANARAHTHTRATGRLGRVAYTLYGDRRCRQPEQRENSSTPPKSLAYP